jgi:hypothetical protein
VRAAGPAGATVRLMRRVLLPALVVVVAGVAPPGLAREDLGFADLRLHGHRTVTFSRMWRPLSVLSSAVGLLTGRVSITSSA